MSVTWRGDEVTRRVIEAAKWGIDKTMSEAVITAKRNHPGWRNVTGAAEGSVRIIRAAHESGGAIVGIWGSTGVNYVIWLELKHGSFLRTAADRTYKNLAGHIRSRLRR